MRVTRILAITGVSLSLFGASQAEIETSFSAGYTSEYVYRGALFGDDLFDFGIEASGSGELGGLGDLGFTGGIWYASFSGGNELDIYGEVSKDLGSFSLAVGITNYSYFGLEPAIGDDVEPYVSVGTEVGGVSLGVSAYYDESDSYGYGFYWEFSAEYAIGDVGLSATYGYFDDEVDYFALSAGYDIAVSDSITISPHITATFSDDLGAQTYAGVGVGFGF
jgi:hypothetical protein